MYVLKKEDLKDLLAYWSNMAEVFSPQLVYGQAMLLPYEEENFTMDYINFPFPFKEYFFKQKEVLFKWERKDGTIKFETPESKDTKRKIFFGIRSCEVWGIKYTDKFFLNNYKDNFYENNRKNSVIVAVNCNNVGEDCFCSSMKTGPFADSGYDLLFTELKEGYLVEVGSKVGEELIKSSEKFFKEASEARPKEKKDVERKTLEKFKRKIETDNIGKVLQDNFDNPIWKGLSKDCVTCTGCTNLCPTCTCFNVVEENIDENSGQRVRYWDSCQSDSFTRNAGKHNPRNSVSRVRYRIFDKFKYIEEKFNLKGCTGCGRCINTCPASIDVVELINTLAKGNSNLKERGENHA